MFTHDNSAYSLIQQTLIIIILRGLYCFGLSVFLNHRVLQSFTSLMVTGNISPSPRQPKSLKP